MATPEEKGEGKQRRWSRTGKYPEDPSAKEPLEEGGEKLKAEEPGKSPEKKGRREEGEREEDPLLEFQGQQGSRWLYHQSSSSSDDDNFTPWDLPTRRRLDPFAPRFDFEQANYYRESLFIARALQFSLGRLSPDELLRFRRKLREIPLEEGFVRIPEEALHKAGAPRLGNLLLSYYGGTYAVEVAADALRNVDCEYQADTLLSIYERKSLVDPDLRSRSV